MHKLFWILFIGILACGNAPVSKKETTALKELKSDSVIPIEIRYRELKDSVRLLKADLRFELDHANKRNVAWKKIGEVFTQLVFQSYFRFWDGTPWAFYGTTEIPQKGTIACGYFVTTVLQDMGVPIQRVAMAKTYSEKLIRTLVQPELIKKYTPFNLPVFVNELKMKATGVYLVGLDNHTGFVVVKNREVYFIHSSVLYPGCVVKEKALESVALQINRYTVLGNLSGDTILLNRWLNP